MAKTPPLSPPITSRHVAVIGAGASGLIAARELRREGHHVVVLEKNDRIGGTWVYTTQVESDPLGLNLDRAIIHSSMYDSLRTNFPRELMGFMDFPFVAKGHGMSDQRRFPGHREVLRYLEGFAREFGIKELVRFECEVVSVEFCCQGKWRVKFNRKRVCGDGNDGSDEEVFDAVVVCNGHHTEPRVAEIPGVDLWPGKQIHSHNYRTPEPFRGQVVILVGASYTAADLSIEIARVAKEVHTASRSAKDDTCEKQPGFDNIWHHSMIKHANRDGSVLFRDGSAINADIILHCTGYKYHFPFLKTSGIVTVEDNRVGPLYKHIFLPSLAPWLSFVGIIWKAAIFPVFELQSKWIAGVLSGRIALPSQEDMIKDVEDLYLTLEASGIPKHHTHNISRYQVDYVNWLAVQCHCAGFEEWRIQMYQSLVKNMTVRSTTFRDEWEDEHLVLEAHKDFSKYTSIRDENDSGSEEIEVALHA